MALPILGAAGSLLAGGATGGGMAAGAGAGMGGGFWQQFQQMYGGGAGGAGAPGGGMSGATQGNAMGGLGALLSGQGDAMRRLSATFRGPTMPFRPHLNTSQVGPNPNMGQIGLSQLLASIATRRG